MQRRREPQYRRRDTRRRTGETARRRLPVPVHLVVLAVLAALAIGVGALVVWADEPAEPAGSAAANETLTEATEETPTGEADETLAAETDGAEPSSHVTFGAHTSATQPCETCHPSQPADEIVCRSCHADMCGKDSKTVADCLACHQTGTTDSWMVDGQ